MIQGGFNRFGFLCRFWYMIILNKPMKMTGSWMYLNSPNDGTNLTSALKLVQLLLIVCILIR